MMASLNPAIRMQLRMLTPTLDAWITPPEYTGLPPIMIATPVGARYDGSIVEIPEGSIITAHLADSDGDAPDLFINGERVAFESDDSGGFKVSHALTGGDTIAIRRGWQDIDSWRIRIVKDQAPKVSFVDPPTVTEGKAVRLAYQASDDYSIKSVAVRIVPQTSRPSVDNLPVEIQLAAPDAKELQRVTFEDMTAYPWSGQPVQMQLIVTDNTGHRSESEAVNFVPPARTFLHPIAKALIEERRKLMQNPGDENIRNETANIMAGVAHATSTYQGDKVVLMALRSGAVRLVLDRSSASIQPVADLLWEAAVRIEDGTVGIAERRLHEAQRNLTDALDRKASGTEVQGLVDRLRDALASYLSALSMRVPRGSAEGLTQASGPQTNMLVPTDINRIFEKIRDLSISGASDAARGELLKLEQQLEIIRSSRASFSAEMHARDKAPAGAHNIIQHLLQNF